MVDRNKPHIPQNMTPAEARMDLAEFMHGGPNSPYFDKWHPLHREAVEAVAALHRMTEDRQQADGTPITAGDSIQVPAPGDLTGSGSHFFLGSSDYTGPDSAEELGKHLNEPSKDGEGDPVYNFHNPVVTGRSLPIKSDNFERKRR
jgi:hypothetical protein